MTPATPRYGNVPRQTWVLRYILLPLARALDWLLCKRHFGVRLLDPERIITRRLDPQRLIKKARAIAGDGPFHLPDAVVDIRLRRAQAALRDANLKGLGAPGDLVVGLPAVAVLDLRVTRAVALNGAYFTSPPGEDALIITGPPRSGTTLLLELLACDEETWRPLTGPEASLPGAVDGDGAVLTSALAGQALAFQSTKEAHFEEVDGPTECRSLLENAGAPYVFWWGPVRKSTSELGCERRAATI